MSQSREKAELQEKTAEARSEIREGIHIARPVIKSILGFLIYLRFGPGQSGLAADPEGEVQRCNAAAEAFVSELEKDLR